jgi:hypothetical protein
LIRALLEAIGLLHEIVSERVGKLEGFVFIEAVLCDE